MRFELRVRTGKQAGKVIPLTGGKFLVGREQDCHLRPNSDLVSRHHCVFLMDDFELRLHDLDSITGTLINGERLQGTATLQSGDCVQVGKLEFEVVISDRLIDCLAPPHAESRIRCRIGEQPTTSVEQLCEEIRIAFDSNHLVFCPCSHESRLATELAAEGPQAISIVGRGFARVIVLDASKACNASGVFDIELFWKNTFVSLSRKLGLDVPAAHHNDRSCIEFLLDLPRSLLCLLNVDRAPNSVLGSLRSMTQEQHPALIQYSSAALSDSEYALEKGLSDTDVEKGLADSTEFPAPPPDDSPDVLPSLNLPDGLPPGSVMPPGYPSPPGYSMPGYPMPYGYGMPLMPPGYPPQSGYPMPGHPVTPDYGMPPGYPSLPGYPMPGYGMPPGYPVQPAPKPPAQSSSQSPPVELPTTATDGESKTPQEKAADIIRQHRERRAAPPENA